MEIRSVCCPAGQFGREIVVRQNSSGSVEPSRANLCEVLRSLLALIYKEDQNRLEAQDLS